MALKHTITTLTGDGSAHPRTANFPTLMKSIDLPLLSRATYSTFTRHWGDSGPKHGQVYPQRRTPDDKRHHPELFYIEWPAASEDFREIHAPTLAAITGNKAPTGHCFRLHEVAALIASMHTIPVPQLLHACRPK